MALYTVEFYRTVTEVAYVTVDTTADNPEHVAREHLDDVDWERIQTSDPVVKDVVLGE